MPARLMVPHEQQMERETPLLEAKPRKPSRYEILLNGKRLNAILGIVQGALEEKIRQVTDENKKNLLGQQVLLEFSDRCLWARGRDSIPRDEPIRLPCDDNDYLSWAVCELLKETLTSLDQSIENTPDNASLKKEITEILSAVRPPVMADIIETPEQQATTVATPVVVARRVDEHIKSWQEQRPQPSSSSNGWSDGCCETGNGWNIYYNEMTVDSCCGSGGRRHHWHSASCCDSGGRHYHRHSATCCGDFCDGSSYHHRNHGANCDCDACCRVGHHGGGCDCDGCCSCNSGHGGGDCGQCCGSILSCCGFTGTTAAGAATSANNDGSDSARRSLAWANRMLSGNVNNGGTYWQRVPESCTKELRYLRNPAPISQATLVLNSLLLCASLPSHIGACRAAYRDCENGSWLKAMAYTAGLFAAISTSTLIQPCFSTVPAVVEGAQGIKVMLSAISMTGFVLGNATNSTPSAPFSSFLEAIYKQSEAHAKKQSGQHQHLQEVMAELATDESTPEEDKNEVWKALEMVCLMRALSSKPKHLENVLCALSATLLDHAQQNGRTNEIAYSLRCIEFFRRNFSCLMSKETTASEMLALEKALQMLINKPSKQALKDFTRAVNNNKFIENVKQYVTKLTSQGGVAPQEGTNNAQAPAGNTMDRSITETSSQPRTTLFPQCARVACQTTEQSIIINHAHSIINGQTGKPYKPACLRQ